MSGEVELRRLSPRDTRRVLSDIVGLAPFDRYIWLNFESEYKYPMSTSPVRTNQSAAPSRIQMLTMQEVADRLGVSLQRAYEMGRTGLLPIVRMGRQIRVEEGRLTSCIESGGRALPGGLKRYPN